MPKSTNLNETFAKKRISKYCDRKSQQGVKDENLAKKRLDFANILSFIVRYIDTSTVNVLNSNGQEVFGPLSLIGSVRRKTWHRTVLDQNSLPTYEALCFRSQRTKLVLHVLQVH